uniref:Uncharacterized protein n=1 Tax=Acrobeloides nanus TaxID=290746 RepID=A0A914BWW3_9BILA
MSLKDTEVLVDDYPSWGHQQIAPNNWLKMPVDMDTISGIIRTLGLAQTNVIWASKDNLAANKRLIFGLVALCGNKMEFEESKPIEVDIHYRLFSKTQVKNANLTLDLLNIKLANNDPCVRTIDQSTLSVIKDICAKDTPDDPSLFVHYILPIAYAHNYVSWLNRSKVKDGDEAAQFVYSFTVQKDGEILWINEDGFLSEFAQSNLSVSDFVDFLRLNGSTDVFALVQDDTDELLKEFHQVSEKIRVFPSPMRNTILDVTHGGSSTNFDFDALAELSTMSEDLDETDDYELFIENQAGEQVSSAKPRPSMSPAKFQKQEKEREKCEKRIKELAKQLSARKKEFPHYGWNIFKLSDKHLDPCFQDFCVFYRKKTSPCALLTTPKSAKRSIKKEAKDHVKTPAASTPRGRPRKNVDKGTPATTVSKASEEDSITEVTEENDENWKETSEKSAKASIKMDKKSKGIQVMNSTPVTRDLLRSAKIAIPTETSTKLAKNPLKPVSAQKRKSKITDDETPKRILRQKE